MTTTLLFPQRLFRAGKRSMMSSKWTSLPANLEMLRHISSMLSDFRPGTPVKYTCGLSAQNARNSVVFPRWRRPHMAHATGTFSYTPSRYFSSSERPTHPSIVLYSIGR